MKTSHLLFLLFFCTVSFAQNRWQLTEDGGINRNVRDVHTDHIEMSGKQLSVILTYGSDEKGRLTSDKLFVFPMLRTIPNDTHGSLLHRFDTDVCPAISVNGRRVRETAKQFYLKGFLRSVSDVSDNVVITREFAPSVDLAAAVEQFTVRNNGESEITVDVEDFEQIVRTHPEKSVYGVYEISARTQNAGIFKLGKNRSVSFAVVYSARKLSEPVVEVDAAAELKKREQFVDLMFSNIRFISPEPVLNRMFDFAKIRAMESIYATKGGLVHGPGGSRYYAAIWANDQAEYANPFFGYTGYDVAIESAMVSWRWFAKYMNDDYRPIPSSIVAEGDSYWNGAGDRGDQAMIAYGATRFALALGDQEKARELLPLIEWCLEFCKRKLNTNGVPASDSDELEGRFPAGEANLCTATLYYDALVSMVSLGKSLNLPQARLNEYARQAEKLHKNINKYFGAKVQGFDTYRYYDGNDILRSWICIPLTVGIYERAAGTIDALFSPLLWTKDGLLTQAGDKTFWDRSTLYGLRGAFAAGATEKALPFFIDYSNRRLLGDHVPYAVEAWPEGNQRHLSAESALYCRTVTEGLFGFRPTGLSDFTVSPNLPEAWEKMELRNLIAFGGKSIDILVSKNKNYIRTEVYVNGKLIKVNKWKNGQKIIISF